MPRMHDGGATMKQVLVLGLFFLLASVPAADAGQQTVFGPKKYDVVERYGIENRYTETFESPEGPYLIQLMNGETLAQRSDYIGFKVNGEVLLPERAYEYRYLACFVSLKKKNTFELVLRDYKPTGFRRPPATPKNVTVAVMLSAVKLKKVVLGVPAWDQLPAYTESLVKITSPESMARAQDAASLENTVDVRADAVKKLTERRDPDTEDFLLHLYFDYADLPEVRGRVALALGALGDKAAIPPLIQGLLDPSESVRVGAARALSLYKEEDTSEPFSGTLERMDGIMKAAVVRATAAAGWRPVGTLIRLAESSDPATANLGIELLGGSADDRAIELLLKYLENPGLHDVRVIITALGESKSRKALTPLTALANDPVKRKGIEVELGTALASIGDPGSVDPIVAMIKQVESRDAFDRLLAAYKKLTGRDFKIEPQK